MLQMKKEFGSFAMSWFDEEEFGGVALVEFIHTQHSIICPSMLRFHYDVNFKLLTIIHSTPPT